LLSKHGGLAGELVRTKSKARGNEASSGGLKVIVDGGWFAARPFGTENTYNIYAESLKNPAYLRAIVSEASGHGE
jgi:phosphoglucomutase